MHRFVREHILFRFVRLVIRAPAGQQVCVFTSDTRIRKEEDELGYSKQTPEDVVEEEGEEEVSYSLILSRDPGRLR